MKVTFYRVSAPEYYEDDEPSFAPTIKAAIEKARSQYPTGVEIVIERIVTPDLPPAELACRLVDGWGGYAEKQEEVRRFTLRKTTD